MTTRILVTGAGGFIGRQLVEVLEDNGLSVLPVTHRWSSYAELESRLADARVTRCIHLGWYASQQDYLTNVDANLASLRNTLDLATLLAARGCEHLLAIGTSAEYGQSAAPLRESDEVSPWSVYGAAKASASLLLRSSLVASGLDVAWGRIFNVTGPGEAADRIVPAVASAALKATPIHLTDGQQVRDFLDVRDVARAIARISESRYRGVVNICSGTGVTLRTLLTAVATRLGRPEVLEWNKKDRSVSDPAYVVGNNQVLRDLGWRQEYEFERLVAGIAEYWLSSVQA